MGAVVLDPTEDTQLLPRGGRGEERRGLPGEGVQQTVRAGRGEHRDPPPRDVTGVDGRGMAAPADLVRHADGQHPGFPGRG